MHIDEVDEASGLYVTPERLDLGATYSDTDDDSDENSPREETAAMKRSKVGSALRTVFRSASGE
jgi:hypothetical protein